MSYPNSSYCCHNLIYPTTYMLHLTLDLQALGERDDEATRVAVAEMASRAGTATAAATGTGIGFVSEDLTYLQTANLYIKEERRSYREEDIEK